MSRVGPLPEKVSERAPTNQLHGEEGPTVISAAQFVNCRDAGMLQPTSDTRFFQKPTFEMSMAAMLRQQHFDRQVAVEVRVAGAQHTAHATTPDLALQREAAQSDGYLLVSTADGSVRLGALFVDRRRQVGRVGHERSPERSKE